MQNNKFWTIWFLLVSTQLSANQFFSLKHDNEGRDYTNQLAELNAADGSVMKQSKLSPSWKSELLRLPVPPSDHLLFYGRVDSKQARIQIVDKSDISQVKSIDTAHLNERVVAGPRMYTFIHLTEDQQHLLMHVGKKKDQQLLVINVQRGEVVHAIPLSKHNNEVSISSDQQYILVNNTSRDELTILRMTDFSVALTSKLGEFRQYGTIHNDHLYLTKQAGKRPKAQYWIQAIDLTSHNKVNFPDQGKELPVFAASEKSGKLYSLTTDEKGKTAIISEVIGTTSQTLKTHPIKKLAPTELLMSDEFDQLLAVQNNRIATFGVNDSDHQAVTKLPFDTANSFYSANGELLYLREGAGSEVAVVDVATGELIERSGTGRPGVKFGQFLGTVALAGVTGGATGYMYVLVKYSNTGMILNHNQDKLYVINWKTNDVTRFNAADLSNRDAIATGRGTFLVHQGDAPTAPRVGIQQQANHPNQ